MYTIAPSLLGAPVGFLQNAIDNCHLADRLHLDIMDGHFVPNLSFGPHIISGLETTLVKDVHLMVSRPHDHIDSFAQAGANAISFHREVSKNTAEGESIIKQIKTANCKVGLAVNPDTALDELFWKLVRSVDYILIMTVVPGFGGQKFRTDMLTRISECRKRFPHIDIQVDGGITAETILGCKEAGANIFVSGSYIFKGEPSERIAQLRSRIES